MVDKRTRYCILTSLYANHALSMRDMDTRLVKNSSRLCCKALEEITCAIYVSNLQVGTPEIEATGLDLRDDMNFTSNIDIAYIQYNEFCFNFGSWQGSLNH